MPHSRRPVTKLLCDKTDRNYLFSAQVNKKSYVETGISQIVL